MSQIKSRTETPFAPRGRSAFFALLVVGLFVLGSAAQAIAAPPGCPDWSLNGQELRYSAADLNLTKSHTVVAGGDVDLDKCGSVPGTGFIQRTPDFTLFYAGGAGRAALEFRVTSECDSVLLVNGPDQKWHFDDDSNGNLDAKLRLGNAPDGAYDIWVGKVGGGVCTAQFHIETFGAAPTAAGGNCPDWTQNGVRLSYTAADLLAPKDHGVTPGDEVDLDACSTLPGTGYLTRAPNFTIAYTGSGQALEFRVTSSCDSTLLVNGPDQQWHFDDDSNGDLDPKLRIPAAASGTYDVWVGKIGKVPCSGKLYIETF